MSSNLDSGILNNLPKKFKIIQEPTKLYYISSNADNQYAIYLYYKQLSLSNLNESFGYLTFSIDYQDKEINIQYLQSRIRGVGIAQYLIFIVAYFAKSKRITKILLDDDSDLAHKNSIYQKVGCKYINNYPEPEMKCNPNVILSKYNNFLKLAKLSGFFLQN